MASKTLSEVIDAKHGLESDFPASALASLLKNAAKVTVTGRQVTVATGRFGGFIADRALKVVSVKAKIQNSGDGGADSQTDVMVRKTAKDAAVSAGVDVLDAVLTWQDEGVDGVNQDGVLTEEDDDLCLNPGDSLDFLVSAAGDGADGLIIEAVLEDRFDS